MSACVASLCTLLDLVILVAPKKVALAQVGHIVDIPTYGICPLINTPVLVSAD